MVKINKTETVFYPLNQENLYHEFKLYKNSIDSLPGFGRGLRNLGYYLPCFTHWRNPISSVSLLIATFYVCGSYFINTRANDRKTEVARPKNIVQPGGEWSFYDHARHQYGRLGRSVYLKRSSRHHLFNDANLDNSDQCNGNQR